MGRGSVRAVTRDVISARRICPQEVTHHGSGGASPYPIASPTFASPCHPRHESGILQKSVVGSCGVKPGLSKRLEREVLGLFPDLAGSQMSF